LFCLSTSIWWATCCPPSGFAFFGFDFSSPVRRLDQPQVSGGLGEHCSSPAVGRGVCAPPGRVAQPRLLAADRGNPKGGKPGAISFGHFSWQDKKSDLPPGNPGGFEFGFEFGFDSDVGYRYAQPNLRTRNCELINSPPLRGDPSTGSGRTGYSLKRCQCRASATRSASRTPASAVSATPPSG
jgi:hypothetical protein